MIYDCFTFFNELDLLEIRLNIMDKYVDKFVIVEATKTQNNKDKILYFEKNKGRYRKFQDKIIHVILNDYPSNIGKWTIENLQRNYIMEGLKNCNNDDIIIISDLDEIPNPKLINKYYKKGRITAFDLDVFIYYLNNYSYKQDWTHGPKILSYYDLKTILNKDKNATIDESCLDQKINDINSPSRIRLYYGSLQKHIKNAGWHFSYIGKKECIEKISSTCEGNNVLLTENAYLNLANNKKFMKWDLIPVKLSSFFPIFIINNQNKYAPLLLNNNLKNIYWLKIKIIFGEIIMKIKGDFMTILKNIFSITNDSYHKVITILGIKMRFRRYSKTDLLLMNQNEILNNMQNVAKSIMKLLLLPDNIFSFNRTKVYVPNFPIDLIQNHIVLNNKYFEEEVLQELDNYIPQGATIFDCGANIGNHTMYWLLTSPKNIKRVHAFEPIKSTFDILRKNIEINNLENKAILYNFGLYDKKTNGCITCYDETNIGGTNVREGEGCIDLRRLDDIDFKEESIDFMKIDVEGSESFLLEGAKNLINKYKPVIFIESFPENYDKVKKFFDENNYVLIKEFEGSNYLYKYQE